MLERGSFKIIIKSNHLAVSDGNPIYIERFGIFLAGNPYLILVQRITNIGNKIASYYYVYGDEPWLGNYGSSIGNIGWVKDCLIKYEVQIDPKKYKFFGFYDYGNDVIGEEHKFTGMANFIGWIYDEPDVAFIVNKEGVKIDKAKNKKPLYSQSSRFIGGQWGPVYLQPKGSQSIALALALGIAYGGNEGKIPIKQSVFFNILSFPY